MSSRKLLAICPIILLIVGIGSQVGFRGTLSLDRQSSDERLSEGHFEATQLLYQAQGAQSAEAKTALLLEVVDIYTNMLAAFPDDETILINRGATYVRLGDYEQAIVDFDKVLLQNPKSVTALENRALAFERTGNLEAADADYERLLKILGSSEVWREVRSERIQIIAERAATVREQLSLE